MGAWTHYCSAFVLRWMSASVFLLSGSWPAHAQDSGQRALSLRLEMILPQSTEVFFGSAADADLLPDGSIVVLDPLNRTLYRFRSDGSFLDSLGRSGQGPGEMRQPVDVEVGPHGEIVVADGTNGRITVWTPDGKVARTIRLTGWPTGLWWRRSGLFLKSYPLGTLGLDSRVFFHRISPDVDTITEPIATFEFQRDPKTLQTRGLSCDLCPAAVTADGLLLLADPDRVAYRVVEARPSGHVTRVWERPGLPPVGFSQVEIELIKESLRKAGVRFVPEWYKIRSRIAAVSMDENGRLWVLRRASDPAPVWLDVFDGDQRLLAEIRLPRGMREFVVRRGRVLTMGESADGEPVVHVYRIVE